jgi:hypothetical protein
LLQGQNCFLHVNHIKSAMHAVGIRGAATDWNVIAWRVYVGPTSGRTRSTESSFHDSPSQWM